MEGKPTKIRRNLMLKEMDIKWIPNGNRRIFSVKFISGSGNLHFFPMVFACGLRYNMKDARQRAVCPCDEKGNATDHVYPVGIDTIIQFNQMEVIL